MRRRHPWWALLATTALVLASLLAPLEGAAYRIGEGPDPTDRGDPDVPNDGPAQEPKAIASKPAAYQTILVIQPAPGMVLRIPLRVPASSSAMRLRVYSR
jgi:hypothetical protein